MNSSSLLNLFRGAFVAFFLYLVLFGVLNLLLVSSVDQSSRQAAQSQEVYRKVTRLRNVLLQFESSQRGYLLTNRKSYLVSVADTNAESEQIFTELKAMISTAEQKRRLGNLESRFRAKVAEMQETINLQAAGNTQGAREIVLTDSGKDMMEQVEDLITELQEQELLQVGEYRNQTAQVISLLRGLMGVGLFGFAIFSGFSYRRVASRFEPLNALVERANLISKGDLTGQPMPVLVRDEIGIVTEAFNSMLSGLKRIFTRTEEAQTKVRQISSRLARSSAEQASSSVQQATAVQETAVTLEELSQSATQIAERAGEVGGESRLTAGESRRGLEAVQESIRLSEKARQGVEDVANTIVALSQKAQDLEAIVSSVNELAERSNILSINASIQAAAAGAEGVTFAVLANEMRLLANRSKEATVEVKGSLAEIRNGIHKAVMMAEEAVKRSQSGDKNSRRTEETIRNMVESFKKGDDAFQQIVAATRQQSHAFKQVEEALVSIQETATQAEKGSRELERDSHELTILSQELHKALNRYEQGNAGASEGA